MTVILRLLDRVLHLLAYWVGGLFLVGLVGATIVDVSLRHSNQFFGNPLFYGSHDISRLLLLLTVGLSLAYGARTGASVAVEIFERFIGPKINRWFQTIIRAFAGSLMSVAAYHLFWAGIKSRKYMEGTQELNIPLEPFYYVFATGVGLYALVLLLEAITLAFYGHVPMLRDESTNYEMSGDTPDESESAVSAGGGS